MLLSSWLLFLLLLSVYEFNPNQHHEHWYIIGAAVHGFVVSPVPSSSTTLQHHHQHSIPTSECQTTTSRWSNRATSNYGGIVSSNRAARRRPRSSTFLLTNCHDNNIGGGGDFNVVVLPTASSNTTSSVVTRIITNDKQKQQISYNYHDDKDETLSSTKVLLDDALDYLASVIEHRLCQCKINATIIAKQEGVGLSPSSSSVSVMHDRVNDVHDNNNNTYDDDDDDDGYARIAKGRFIDLTTTIEGEQILESLFIGNIINPTYNKAPNKDDHDHHHHVPLGVVQLAITTLQSLLIDGMQIGVKGSDEAQLRTVRHLFRVEDDNNNNNGSNNNNYNDNTTTTTSSMSPTMYSSWWSDSWDEECIRKLKYQRNVTLAKLLLGKLKRKRTSQGAYNLLLELHVWKKHEDIALLRSGFPIQLTTM